MPHPWEIMLTLLQTHHTSLNSILYAHTLSISHEYQLQTADRSSDRINTFNIFFYLNRRRKVNSHKCRISKMEQGHERDKNICTIVSCHTKHVLVSHSWETKTTGEIPHQGQNDSSWVLVKFSSLVIVFQGSPNNYVSSACVFPV